MENGETGRPPARWLGGLVVLACASAAWFGWELAERRAEPAPGEVALGSRLLELPLETLDGRSTRLRELDADAILVLDFWATWCAPCTVQSKILAQWSNALPPASRRAIRVIAINVGESPATVEGSLTEHEAADLVLLDRDARSLSELRFAGLPTVVVMDSRGQVRLHRAGITGRRSLQAAIDEAGMERIADGRRDGDV